MNIKILLVHSRIITVLAVEHMLRNVFIAMLFEKNSTFLNRSSEMLP